MPRSIIIGRSSSNDYIINDPYAGREHAQLLITDNEEVFIIDLSSKSGTTVNGKLIDPNKPYKLEEYDIVRTAATLIPWKDFLDKDSLVVYQQMNVQGNLDETIIKPREEETPVKTGFFARLGEKIKVLFNNLFGKN